MSKSHDSRRLAGRQVINPVNWDQIIKETYRKEEKHSKLYTDFSLDSIKSGQIVTGKITSLNETGTFENYPDDVAEQKAREDHEKKYRELLTTTGEYGSSSGLLTTRFDYRPLMHHRAKCEITKYAEEQLKIFKVNPARKSGDGSSQNAKDAPGNDTRSNKSLQR